MAEFFRRHAAGGNRAVRPASRMDVTVRREDGAVVATTKDAVRTIR
eukprot:gene6628-11536_t